VIRRLRTLAALFLLACARTPAPASEPGFVSLAAIDPSIQVEMRYAGADNFVGAPVDGYERAVCLLTERAARALAAVQADLRAESLGLRVYDCYRPQRAVDHFARWADAPEDAARAAAFHPRVPKSELFARGYVARHSSHSRGSTLDVTLVGADGAPLDMGTPFDLFDERSHTESQAVGAAARAHRLRLRSAMERRGFRNLPVEWWHYTLADEPHPERGFDVPVR
jgi:D-alanyl-D-alanine dipeptidase